MNPVIPPSMRETIAQDMAEHKAKREEGILEKAIPPKSDAEGKEPKPERERRGL